MPNNSYRNLPVETMYDLLIAVIQEMLDAMDKDDPSAVTAKRKLVEILILNITEKKKK